MNSSLFHWLLILLRMKWQSGVNPHRCQAQLHPMPGICPWTTGWELHRLVSFRPHAIVGSLIAYISALHTAFQMMSLSNACHCWQPAFLWQAKPLSPLALTFLPQMQFCGSQVFMPSRCLTVTLIVSSSSLIPTAWSEIPATSLLHEQHWQQVNEPCTLVLWPCWRALTATLSRCYPRLSVCRRMGLSAGLLQTNWATLAEMHQ